MKYQLTVRVEIEIFETEEGDFSALMNAFREGLRMNHRLASRVRSLTLLTCRLIEPEKENVKLMEDKDNDR